MSVPSAELTAPALGAPSRTAAGAISRRLAGWRLYALLGAAALLIAGLSLLIPSTPSYDPWAWLVWGREIAHLKLQTTGGPTWKPLPVIFTTLFAPFGHAAPDMWLVVGRAGAVMAVVMTFRLCVRLARQLSAGVGWATGGGAGALLASWAPGLLAGGIACIGLVFAGGYITSNALGYSEGLMTAVVLIAVERHLDGYPRHAFAVGFFAALDRPEIWLFWGPYGLWLWWRDPDARRLVYVLFALIPVLWFLPELWGSGQLFRGVSRANNPRSNSPAFASCPFCKELSNASVTVLSRIKIAAGAGVLAGALLLLRALRSRSASLRAPLTWTLESRRERALLAIVSAGVFGFGWWVVIAVLTQAGFSGNNRYLVLGAALIEIAGGATWGWAAIELTRAARRRPGLLTRGAWPLALAIITAAFLFVPGFVGNRLTDVQATHRALVYQAHLRSDLNKVVSEYGGAKKVLACGNGRVMTEGFQVPMVAYALGVHTLTVEAPPDEVLVPAPWPNVIFQDRETRHATLLPQAATILNWDKLGARFVQAEHVRTFRLFTDCRK
jgi:hypothetical protein